MKTGFKKGHKIWSGRTHTKTARLKISVSHKGKLNYQWQGDKPSYMALHNWLKRTFGNPKLCEHCGKNGKKVNGKWNIDWAKIRGKTYNRRRLCFFGLCRKCHMQYDYGKD